MCQSKAQGGQRCSGHAGHALGVAEARYRDARAEAQPFIDARTTFHGPGLIPLAVELKGRKARMALEDALARYASTYQGDQDLTARIRHLNTGPYPATPQAHVDNALESAQYENAVAAGRAMARRNKDIAADVKAGLLTGPQATGVTSYPTEQLWADRDDEIAEITAWGTFFATNQWVGAQKEQGIAGRVRAHFPNLFQPDPTGRADQLQDPPDDPCEHDHTENDANPTSRHQTWLQHQPEHTGPPRENTPWQVGATSWGYTPDNPLTKDNGTFDPFDADAPKRDRWAPDTVPSASWRS